MDTRDRLFAQRMYKRAPAILAIATEDEHEGVICHSHAGSTPEALALALHSYTLMDSVQGSQDSLNITAGDLRCIAVCWGGVIVTVVLETRHPLRKSIQRTLTRSMQKIYGVKSPSASGGPIDCFGQPGSATL